MKEATSDLNMTLIIVMIIGAMLAFFYSVVWPGIKSTIGNTADCGRAVCSKTKNSDGTVDCKVYNKDGSVLRDNFTCTWKG